MNSLKKLISERFKTSSKKAKDKKYIKDQISSIKKNPEMHYKEVRDYYKKNKHDENNKIVSKYTKLMGGDKSLTEFFDDYYKDIQKNLEEAVKNDPSIKDKNNVDMDAVFKDVIFALAENIRKEFGNMYRKIFRDQNILIKNFSTNGKAIYKDIRKKYNKAQSDVIKAYKSCKDTFKNDVEKHIIGDIKAIRTKELHDLAKLIQGGVNPKYVKGDLETSINNKNYLVGMKVKDGKNVDRIITNNQSQYSDETLKTNINKVLKDLMVFKKKAKYVTEKDMKQYKEGFDKDVSLVECCMAGMEIFAEELPKMVKKCAALEKEDVKRDEYESYMNERNNQDE